MKKETAIWVHKSPKMVKRNGISGWYFDVEHTEVRVMARADGYAMVRHPRCMPFVVPEKELEKIPKP